MNTKAILLTATLLSLAAGFISCQTLLANEEAATDMSLEGRLKSRDPEQWEAALVQNTNERQAIVKALIEHFKNEKERGDARKAAAFLLARTHSPEATEFLFENIAVELPVSFIMEPGEIFSCSVALHRYAGWEKIPAILKYLQGERNEMELWLISEIAGNVPGDRALLAVLEVEYAFPRNDTQKKNLRLVMDYMMGRMAEGELTAAQWQRKRMLAEKKIQYGEITDGQKEGEPGEPPDEITPPADESTPSGVNNSTLPASDDTPLARDTSVPSSSSHDSAQPTSAVAEARPFPWAIVIVVAIAALALGAITTLLLTRAKKTAK